MIFQWNLVCFEILYQLPVFYPQCHPRSLNQLYVKFQQLIPDLKVYLDRVRQDQELSFRE